MKNKNNIVKVLLVTTIATTIPVNVLASNIEESKVESSIENSIENKIKRIFAKIFGHTDSQISNRKERIKVNKNIVEGKVLNINLGNDDFVPDLSGNPDGYETIKVITIGDKKLDSIDFARLKDSGIPKINLSEAKADSIPNSAFKECNWLTEFKFPQGIISIEDGAFSGCSGLTGNLNLPNTLTNINGYAFYECTGFSGSLTIPDSVETIGDSAFYRCTGFNGDLVIGSSVKTIGGFAFSNCSGFEGSLNLPEGLITINEQAFAWCDGFRGNLIIPSTVRTIGNNAFLICSNLTGNLIIPNSVTTIGAGAFNGCSGFTGNLVISNAITAINDNTFKSCAFTGNLTIPEGVTTIGTYAFDGCDFTGSLVIPDSVTSIGRRAFGYCSGFTGDLVIPSSITTIEDYTFMLCGGFNGNLVIPDSITSIGNQAFYGCSRLTGNLIIPESVTNIGAQAFSNCEGFNGNLVIPNGITTIRDGAFSNCRFTGNLVIPDSVTSIGQYAFYGCTGFEGNIMIPNSVTSISSNALPYYLESGNIIINVSESDVNTNYRKNVIDNLPIDITCIEISYNFDVSGTWLDSADYTKVKPSLSTYSGKFENNEGVRISLNIPEAYSIKTISITKDGLDYTLDKDSSGSYVFGEAGDYNIYIETELGTISNIYFKNIIPKLEPSISYKDNVVEIIDNGIISKKNIAEEFNNPDNLKFSFSNPNWNVESGILKSEAIDYSSLSENEFTYNAKAGDKLTIRLKTFSEDVTCGGYIYINGNEVYQEWGSTEDFKEVEFDLQEGENIIKFSINTDLMSTGEDFMLIDYIKIKSNEEALVECDTIEYRINGGEWQLYTGAFELDYPVGTRVLLEFRAKHDGFVGSILSQEIIVEKSDKEIEKAVEKAELSKNPVDISDARDLVNNMPDSSKKDVLQNKLNLITPIATLTPKNITANVDVYVKSENMLKLSLDTNSITFEDFSGVVDIEKPNALNLEVSSSLPYQVDAYLATEIQNTTKDKNMNKEILKIKANIKSEDEYKSFADVNTTPITLLDDQVAGNNIVHGVDFKLEGGKAYEKDNYKTTIKFEVKQK